MIKVASIKKDPFSISAGDIKNLDFNTEVTAIESEISSFFQTGTAIEMQQSELYNRIDTAIQVLTVADNNVKAKNALKAARKDLSAQLKIKMNGYHVDSGTVNIEETEQAIDLAHQQIAQAKKDIIEGYTNQQLKLALMEGYATVNLMRAYFFGEIEYKILTIGEYSGQDVILEAHPTLADLFKSASFDPGSGVLKITETKKQFEKIMQQLEDDEKKLKMANPVLSQMEQVQLSTQDRNMWKMFVDLKTRLESIQGAALNYGNMAESFVTYQLEDLAMTVDNVYDLLEKGRNNLAYYLGADVGNYQVKALSTYGKVGRADIATLSNVINPLKELRTIITNGSSPSQIAEKIKEFFTAKEGQGDRPFSEAVGVKVRQEVEGAVANNLTW